MSELAKNLSGSFFKDSIMELVIETITKNDEKSCNEAAINQNDLIDPISPLGFNRGGKMNMLQKFKKLVWYLCAKIKHGDEASAILNYSTFI